MLERLRVELGEKAFERQLQDMYYFSCNFFEYLVVPLGLYLPVLQPLWQEPMDVAEEVEEFRYSQEPAVRVVAKPPAMLRPTQYGVELLARLSDVPMYLEGSEK
jgi:hypothetical protein